jgi:hypothetical protein
MGVMKIVIDLNEYEVEIDGAVAVIKDAPMDLTVPEWHRNRVVMRGRDEGEYMYSTLPFMGLTFDVEQEGEDWRITNRKGPIGMHHVVGVVRANFDAIIDLGWEALKP